MLLRLWLIFAQAATVAVAALFVVSTFRPEWLPRRVAEPPVPHGVPAATTTLGAASYHEAVRRAMPAVVNISTSKQARTRNPLRDDPLFRQYFGAAPEETQRASSLGSGVIVSTSGYVLTNNHVVDAADEIEVALADGRKLLAEVVGNDPDTDLAVLRVKGENLPAISFGSSDALRVGDVVLAMGNPFSFGHTVTLGIVSALGRSGLGVSTFENFIQTDAAINPGNSGGALIDTTGSLVGINTVIFSGTGGSMGIGFAIPATTAKMVLDQIVKSGGVTRGWIGVEVQELSPAMADSFKLPDTRGALIAGVLRGGPADKGGVKPGDVLVEVQGKPVADPTGMLNLIAALAPGQPAKLKVKRQGQDIDATVTVGRRPKPVARAE
jgi:serine protease DegQ